MSHHRNYGLGRTPADTIRNRWSGHRDRHRQSQKRVTALMAVAAVLLAAVAGLVAFVVLALMHAQPAAALPVAPPGPARLCPPPPPTLYTPAASPVAAIHVHPPGLYDRPYHRQLAGLPAPPYRLRPGLPYRPPLPARKPPPPLVLELD